MKTKKIVIIPDFGTFSLNINIRNLYAEKKGFELFHYAVNYDEENANVFYSDSYIKVTDPNVTHCYSVYMDLGEVIPEEVLEDSEFFCDNDIERDDLILIENKEKLKLENSPSVEDFKIVEIPSDIEWEVVSSDYGCEFIQEKSRKWY